MTNLEVNCPARIKPILIRDIKTEALLVFARTALEKGFERIENEEVKVKVGNADDTKYVYDVLKKLMEELKVCVVNADYLISLIQKAKVNHEYKQIAKNEEPLILYYDSIAKRIDFHSKVHKKFIPELIVISMMSQWLLEEEKSISLYPFLENFNFLELTEKFELNSEGEEKNNVLNMFKVSFDLVNTLKRAKYKYNSDRVSKTRKKRKK